MKLYYKMFFTHVELQLWVNKHNLVEKIVSIGHSQASLYSSLNITVWYKSYEEVTD